MGRQNGAQPLWNTVWPVIKLNIVLTYNLVIVLLGIYPVHLKIYVHTNTHMKMYTEALLTMAKKQKLQKANV